IEEITSPGISARTRCLCLTKGKAEHQMIPFIGPEFSDYLLEGRRDSEEPLGILLATEQSHDDDNTRSLLTDGDESSDQHVWSDIRYLDPTRRLQNNSRAVLVSVIALFIEWTVILAVLLSLVV